jgi:hypothetical protein
MYVEVDMERDASPHACDGDGQPLTCKTLKDAASGEHAMIQVVHDPAHLRAPGRPLPVVPRRNVAFPLHAVTQG